MVHPEDVGTAPINPRRVTFVPGLKATNFPSMKKNSPINPGPLSVENPPEFPFIRKGYRESGQYRNEY